MSERVSVRIAPSRVAVEEALNARNDHDPDEFMAVTGDIPELTAEFIVSDDGKTVRLDDVYERDV